MLPEMVEIGGLECVHIKGNGQKGAVVLLHGFGASAYDLYSLQNYLKVPEGMDWYFPNGILEVPFTPTYSGRAWFPISISGKIQQAVLTGDWSEIGTFIPPGLDEARDRMNTFLSHIPFSFEQIVLGGFSQGAMLSLDVFLHKAELPKSLILLSGTMLKENEWKQKAKAKSGFQFFQSHGTEDPVLPYAAAKRLENMLREAGLVGEFVSFQGGHEIPDSVIKRVNQYLNR
jgi:phospholipase/carboxylesterase